MGRIDVDAMLAEMTATQLAEWEAFCALEPFGAQVEDHRAGIVASAVANFAGKTLRKGKELGPSDFFPSRTPKPKVNVRDQVHAIFGPLAAAQKGRK
jgi:hypothetical protein